MRFILIPDDRMVYVNGDARKVHDHVTFPSDVHAVQWYEDHGEVEYKPNAKGGYRNETITDISPYEHYLEHHAEAKKRDQEIEAREAEMARQRIEAADSMADRLEALEKKLNG